MVANYEEEKKVYLETMLNEYMKKYSIHSVEELVKKTDEELLKMKNFNIQLVLYIQELKKKEGL